MSVQESLNEMAKAVGKLFASGTRPVKWLPRVLGVSGRQGRQHDAASHDEPIVDAEDRGSMVTAEVSRIVESDTAHEAEAAGDEESAVIGLRNGDLNQDMIRRIIREEIRRFMSKEHLRSEGLESRLELLADALSTVENKILELRAGGVSHASAVTQAVASVDNLGEEERNVLASIFNENLKIQKES